MKRLIILLLAFNYFSIQAQVNTDSLWQIVRDTTQLDTIRLEASFPLLNTYSGNNADTAIMISKLQLDLAEKTDDLSWISYALFQSGYVYFEANQYKKSIEIYNKAIKSYTQIGGRKESIANCRSNIALSLIRMGQYEEAFQNYSKSRDLYIEVKDTSMIARTINQLGMVRDYEGRWLESLDLYFEALKIFEELNNEYGQSVVLLNISSVYKEMNDKTKTLDFLDKSRELKKKVGDEFGEAIILSSIATIYAAEGKIDKALINHQEAFSVFEKFGNMDKMGESYKSMASVYLKNLEINRALDNINKAISLQKELELLPDLSESFQILGKIYIHQNEFQKAVKSCTKGYEMAKELGYLDSEKNNCFCLSKTYEKLNNHKLALQFYKNYDNLQDSLIDQEVTRKATRKEMVFSFAKQTLADSLRFIQEQEIINIKHETQLKQEKTQRIFLYGGIGIVSFFSIFLFNRFRVTSKQKDIISKEKQRSEKLLLNILPEETAEELKTFGTAKARNYEAVTVMFTDFKSFTKISEQLSPQELVSEIDHCFKAFDNIIEKYQIEKIKTIGDAYMCVSGLPKTNQNHARDIISAALEIRDFIELRKTERVTDGHPAFEVRIGIHTGPVVAGVVGHKKFTYDIWGDTVNTAARMESSGEVGKVNISGVTSTLIQSDFNISHRGKISAKNKGQIDMYFVENLS